MICANCGTQILDDLPDHVPSTLSVGPSTFHLLRGR